MAYDLIFVILAVVVGLWMTLGIGSNDLANIMSTTMGSKAISVRQALSIAIVFELLGAFVGGTEVSATVKSGIIDLSVMQQHPNLFIYIMLSVLLASAVWLNCASVLGMPVSITQAIIGSLVGVGAIELGLDKIAWHNVSYICISWIFSPLIAGVISFVLFVSIRQYIFNAKNPIKAANYLIPGYCFIVGAVLAMMTLLKLLAHYHVQVNQLIQVVLVLISALIIVLISGVAMKNIKRRVHWQQNSQLQYIENLFAVLMAFTACAMVFAHGSNDVAIAIGPVLAVINTVLLDKSDTFNHSLLSLSLLAGSVGVIVGLLLYGRKVIATVGRGITILTPSRAFAATFAAAIMVTASTTLGLPVSATQTLVGAVLGVGIARGIDALNLTVIRNIFLSWVLTVPISAIVATMFFLLLHKIFD